MRTATTLRPSARSRQRPRVSRRRLVQRWWSCQTGMSSPSKSSPSRNGWATTTVRMLAYNGSIPGPTLKVPEGSTVTVQVTNHGDLDATVHWHGLRLENRYDGTHETQAAIPVGETFTYQVHFP